MNAPAPAHLRVSVPGWEHQALPLVLRDARLRLIDKAQTEQELTLPPGGYLVQLSAPDGSVHSAFAQLQPGEARTLRLSLDREDATVERRRRGTPAGRSRGAMVRAGMVEGGALPTWSARLWTFHQGEWQAVAAFPPLEVLELAHDAGTVRVSVRLEATGPGLLFAEVKGSAGPPVTLGLPMAGGALDTCRLELVDDGVALQATARLLQRDQVQLIADYLQGGAVEQAAELLGDAEELLYGKVGNPLGAALGGYALLRLNALERLHDWPRNLTERMDWLPDGAIIYAEQLARRGEHARAADWLLEAGRRGLPLFGEGMDLMLGRLRHYLLLRKAPVAGEPVMAGLRSLLGWISPWATQMAAESVVLAVEGRSPRDDGAPDAPWHAIDLASLEQGTHP